MAEVKRRNGIPSMPIRNPPSFNHSSTSYKHIYEDVFASPLQSRQQSTALIDDDYAEMFGSSRSNNGTWSISYSSIPVLDLPPPTEMRVRGVSGVTTVSGDRGGGNLDYSGVFGGFGDGNFGLPNGEELFDQLKKKTKTSNVIPRGKVQTVEASRPEMFRQSETQSIDDLQDFKRNKKEDVMKKSGEIKKVARASDFPGTTNKVEEAVPAQTTLSEKIPVVKDDDTQLGKDVNFAVKQGKLDRHITMDLGADVKNNDSVFRKESGLNASNSTDNAHDTSQSATGTTNTFSQPSGGSSNSLSETSDGTKLFDHMNNKMHNTRTSEPIGAAEVHAIPESTSTSTLHETEPTHLPSKTSAIEDNIETKMNVNTSEHQGKHSVSTCSEPKASLNNSEPFSLDTSQDTPHVTMETELSKKVNDDVTISFDVKRKGRHSRITSLDLGDRKHSREQDGQSQRKPRFGGSYSFDASNDSHAARVKVHPSMMAPSSSVPQFFPVESRYKISENSTWRNFGSDVYKDGSVSPPSLEEQLDTNSAAAMSAVALQRAIEEASMIFQMAKEYLERESQGSSKVRFKDTLKVKVANDEQFADKMDEFQHCRTYESYPPKDTDKPKLSFVKDTLKVKVSKDNQLEDEMNRFQQPTIHKIYPPRESEKERLLVSERPSVMENGQSSQVFEDLKKVSNDMPTVQDQNNKDERHKQHIIVHDNSLQGGSGKERPSLSESTSVLENGLPPRILEDPKKPAKDDHMFQDGKNFVHDEGCMEERNPDMSEYTDERDRQEGGAGGEWEAAKHLNQLICGVKNKIASFMAWQTDTEKKEDLKETEACRRFQLHSEGGPDLVDMEHAEMKTKLTDQVRSGCPGEHVEMEIGFLSEIVDPCEDESVWNNTAGQEKDENSVDLNPVVASSSPESLIFFPFRNEEVHDPMDTNEEQNVGSEECSEIEFMNVQDDVLSEIKYEQLQDKCKENNHEALDDTCITRNREVLDDDFTSQHSVALDDSCNTNHEALDDSDIEVINKTVEEPCLLAGKEKNESTDEDPKRSLDEESREDPVHDSHYPESTAESIDENINCGEDPTRSLVEECREDPLHDSHFPEITTENIDESGNCEEYDETKESENWQHDAQILEETDPEGDIGKGIQAVEETHECREIERDQSQNSHIEEAAGQIHGCDEFMADDTLDDPIEKIEVAEKESLSSEDACMKSESSCIEVITEEITEEASFVTEVVDELTKTENAPIEDSVEQVACFETVEDDSQKAEHVCLSESEGPFTNDHGSGMVEEVVSSDEKHDSTMEILKSSSEAKSKKEETVIFYDSFVELDGITEDLDYDDDDDETLQVENSGLHSSRRDVYLGKDEIGANVMETESRDILENQSEHVGDSEESLDVGVANTISGQEVEKCGVDAVQKRRRWFDNGVKVGLAERPSILEGDITEVETDQESLDESILAGSVEIHSDELDNGRREVNQESVSVNSESTPKRRRWSVKIGEEGLPVPPPLFQGINVEEPQNIVNETLPHSKSESSLGKLNATEADISVNKEKDKSSVEAPPRRKRWFGSGDNVGPISQPRSGDDAIDQDSQVMGARENHKCDNSSSAEETEVEPCKMEEVNDRHADEANRKEKERMVVERAIREARERAFAEARDRARRDTSERPNVEVRQKVGAGYQERVGKVPTEARGPSDKASMDAKLRAERAAVERATTEARERALQKALLEKASHRSREQKNTSDPNFQSSSSFSRADVSNRGEKYDGFDSESAQRRKTRTERQSRTTEQPATALDEKNRRDLLVQKEQAAKNMMADSLDAELKRWSAGKEGNLRLLLSTLQYILGPESGWQAVTLTDLMAATAVRKAYKKATLCVHPDKLQQRGATIQQKYICERVFDLLKDAWSKLNPNER